MTEKSHTPDQGIAATMNIQTSVNRKIDSGDLEQIKNETFKMLNERQELIKPYCSEKNPETNSIYITNIDYKEGILVADGFDVADPESATYGTPLSWQVNVSYEKAFAFKVKMGKKTQELRAELSSDRLFIALPKDQIIRAEMQKLFEEEFIQNATSLHAKWHGYLSNGVQFRPSAKQYLPEWSDKEDTHVIGVNYTVMGAEKTLRPEKGYTLKNDGRKQVIDTTSRLLGNFKWDKLQNIYLDGHSMGGNIAFWVSFYENELLDAIHDPLKGKFDPDRNLRIEYRYKTPVIGGADVRKGHVKVLEGIKGKVLREAARYDFLKFLGAKTKINDYLVKSFIQPHGFQLQPEMYCTLWQVNNDYENFRTGTLELETTEDIVPVIREALENPNSWKTHPFAQVIREGRAAMFINLNDPILRPEDMHEAALYGFIPTFEQPDVHFNTPTANELYQALAIQDWDTIAQKTNLWMQPDKAALNMAMIGNNMPEVRRILHFGLSKMGWLVLNAENTPQRYKNSDLRIDTAWNIQSHFARVVDNELQKVRVMMGDTVATRIQALEALKNRIPIVHPTWLLGESTEILRSYGLVLAEQLIHPEIPIEKRYDLVNNLATLIHSTYDENPFTADGLNNYWDELQRAFPENFKNLRSPWNIEFDSIDKTLTKIFGDEKLPDWVDCMKIWSRMVSFALPEESRNNLQNSESTSMSP